MKQFNEVIIVEVCVDEIAAKLLAEFSGESAHKEIIVEAIIGNLLNKGRLGQLYSAINGYKTEINFKVGQIVNCKTTSYNCNKSYSVLELNPLGICKILEIDEYQENPIKVEYQEINQKNVVLTRSMFVSIRDLESTDLPYGEIKPHFISPKS